MIEAIKTTTALPIDAENNGKICLKNFFIKLIAWKNIFAINIKKLEISNLLKIEPKKCPLQLGLMVYKKYFSVFLKNLQTL